MTQPEKHEVNSLSSRFRHVYWVGATKPRFSKGTTSASGHTETHQRHQQHGRFSQKQSQNTGCGGATDLRGSSPPRSAAGYDLVLVRPARGLSRQCIARRSGETRRVGDGAVRLTYAPTGGLLGQCAKGATHVVALFQ